MQPSPPISSPVPSPTDRVSPSSAQGYSLFAVVLGCILLGCILLGCIVPGCNIPVSVPPAEDESNDDQPPQLQGSVGQQTLGDSPTPTGPAGTPKDLISHQYVLIRNGRTEDLKKFFIKSLHEEITPELIEERQKNMKRVSLSDLVHEVLPEEGSEPEVYLIKRKDGRTLTRVIRQGNHWEADTLWFK